MKTNGDMDWLEVMAEKVSAAREDVGEEMWEAVSALAAGQRRRARARRSIALVAGLAAAAAVSALFLLPEGAVDAPQNAIGLMAESGAGETVEAVGTVGDIPAVEGIGSVVPESEIQEPEILVATAAKKPLVAAAPSAAEVCRSVTSESVSSETRPAADAVRPTVSASSVNPSWSAAEHPEVQSPVQTVPQNSTAAASIERYVASLDGGKMQGRRFSIAFSANTISSHGEATDVVSLSSVSGEYEGIPAEAGLQGAGVVTLQNKVRYSVPVSAGIVVSSPISERLAIESGVSYTMLVSYVGLFGNIKLESHYLGVPLALRADLCSAGKSDLYVRAGGMIEACVAAKADEDPLKTNSIVLWSAMGAAGYQYALGEACSIYIEPGISYHFGDFPKYSIYEVSPCLFSLQAGLRFYLKHN